FLGTILFSIFMILCYKFTLNMNVHINSLLSDVKLLKQNQIETSLGYRISFHQYAKSLMAENPLWGIGTGGFKHRFLLDNPIPNWGPNVNEPHSQYWFLLVEQGLVGMLLFCAFLGSLVIFAFKQLQETRPILLGFLLAFVVGCFTDTLFSYSVVGYLLVMITAVCFGEYHEQREGYQMAIRSTGLPKVHSSEMEPSLQTTSPLSS
ncbi:MAG: O-antigen ligase domain-containing protein, partial [Legionella sp.]